MIKDGDVISLVATADPTKARSFYHDVLGLDLVNETPFALEFDSKGRMLRVQIVEQVLVAPYTVLGWIVKDINAEIEGLKPRGVVFERFPWLSQDENGVWTSPSGARVAWFKDPDGNTLSLTQF